MQTVFFCRPYFPQPAVFITKFVDLKILILSDIQLNVDIRMTGMIIYFSFYMLYIFYYTYNKQSANGNKQNKENRRT